MRLSRGAILAVFAISIGCFAQNSMMLTLKSVKGGGEVSATFASDDWDSVGSGKAQLRFVDIAGGPAPADVQFTVRGKAFRAQLPPSSLPKDSVGVTWTLFYPPPTSGAGNQKWIIQAESAKAAQAKAVGESASGTPAAAEPAASSSQNSGVPQGTDVPAPPPADQSTAEGTKQEEPESSWLGELFHGRSPAWLPQVLLLLVLASTAWTVISSESTRRVLKMVGRALEERQGQERLTRQSQNPLPVQFREDPHAATALEEARRAMNAVGRVDTELKQLRQSVEELSRSVVALRTLGDDFRSVESSLRDWKQSERRPASPVLKLAIPLEAAALVAVVNKWLAQGGGDRSKLSELAREAQVNAKLAAHKDLNRVFQDLTTFEYPFEFSPDGGWLWAAIPGGGEFWAVPTDSALFSMGSAPLLLDRLFDGFKEAKAGFQFVKIYRPCRLRAVSGGYGKYALVERGLLRLEGAPSPPESEPAAFDSFVHRSSTGASFSNSPGLGQLLAQWIRQAGRQLEDHAQELGSIRESVRSVDHIHPESSEDKIRRLRSDLIERLEVHAARIGEIERSITQPQTAPSAPPPALKRFVGGSSAEEKAAGAKSDTVLNLGTAGGPNPGGGLRAGSAEVLTTPEKTEEAVMPDRWQEAVQRAASDPGSEPAMSGVPAPDLYQRRTLILARELNRLNPNSAAATVHVRKHPVENRFEIHEVADAGFCMTCKASQSWQLAVRIGKRDALQIFVLFPLGTLGKGNYASGYSALIEESLPSLFTIGGIAEPATLRLIEDSSKAYGVARKMSLLTFEPGQESV